MVFKEKTRVILASASPRRKQLLKELIHDFSVKVSNADEQSKYTRPHKRVMDIAKAKADLVDISKDQILISADTTVYLKGIFYDKPLNAKRAKAMLLELNGKTHCVYTGVCIKTHKKTIMFYEKSSVTFKHLDERSIDKYILDKQPFDKAGAYGIQDDFLVKSYKGSYTNIVGLPIEKLEAALLDLGLTLRSNYV